MRLFFCRVKIFFRDNWGIITISTLVIGLIVGSYLGFRSMESFYQKMTLANLPLNLLMVGINAVIFAFVYLHMFRDSLTKLRGNQIKAKKVNITFDDVIGIDEAKEEAWEIVELIKDRNKIKQIGGKIIKGLLMVGHPGCGKTLLAKAIATEAGIPFLSISGSEFVEVFVGVGASRVRKLFSRARSLAEGHGSCIIFIDELDVIGRGRTFTFGGSEETNSTQNQLLVEMDGLNNSTANIIIIGATNAAESVLDKALLRPGRFDRKIYIDKPNLEGREKIIKYYLGKVKHDAAIDIGRLARQTVHKSPADIENIIKEAALLAMKNGKDIVEFKDLSAAIERIDLGIKHKRSMAKQEREMIAFHETGHLVSLYILHPTNDVFKASIISRKETLGVVHHQPREEYFTQSKEKMLADIKVSLAGYVAERLKYSTTSTGVSSDFQKVMMVAHTMVWKLGMSDDRSVMGDYSVIPPEQLSEKTKAHLNAEVEKLISDCYKDVEDLLKKEWEIVERFAKELLAKDELEYDEIEAIFNEYGKGSYQINKSTNL